MKKHFTLLAISALVISSCGVASRTADTAGDVAVVAHRGFWDCEQAGYAQNSIGALRAAQQAGFWGSEFDVNMTLDEQLLVVNYQNFHESLSAMI